MNKENSRFNESFDAMMRDLELDAGELFRNVDDNPRSPWPVRVFAAFLLVLLAAASALVSVTVLVVLAKLMWLGLGWGLDYQ